MPRAPCSNTNNVGLFRLRNWLTITLLNVDYKFASQVLAGRLLKVFHVVVNEDQACGAQGRFFGENAAFLRDIIDYATFSNFPAAVLSLEQKKAFDRVDWSFMLGIQDGLRSIPSSLSPFVFYRCSGLC